MESAATPHTKDLRTVERFTRRDFNTMKYEVLIDDPSIYTRPWSGGFDFRWSPNLELFEYVCQDFNTAPELMMKDNQPISFISPFIP